MIYFNQNRNNLSGSAGESTSDLVFKFQKESIESLLFSPFTLLTLSAFFNISNTFSNIFFFIPVNLIPLVSKEVYLKSRECKSNVLMI